MHRDSSIAIAGRTSRHFLTIEHYGIFRRCLRLTFKSFNHLKNKISIAPNDGSDNTNESHRPTNHSLTTNEFVVQPPRLRKCSAPDSFEEIAYPKLSNRRKYCSNRTASLKPYSRRIVFRFQSPTVCKKSCTDCTYHQRNNES